MSNDVVLNPINPILYQTPHTEPQYITSKSPNKAIIYLDSQDCTLETNKVDIVMSTIKTKGEYPSNLAYGVSRLSFDSIHINWITPNVNPRNNTLKFFSSVTNSFFTVIIPEGFYTSSASLMVAIIAALNTATGSSGLTFSSVAVITQADTYLLNCVGGSYYIALDCTAITRGYQLYNFPITQIPETSKKMGAMSGRYTRYVDICSSTLSQYLKIRTVTTGNANNVIFRAFLNDIAFDHPGILSIDDTKTSNISYNYVSNSPINAIDFQLRDQFGDLLYIPPGSVGTPGGFYWDCALTIEL